MIVADLSAQGAAQSLHSACRERGLAVELLINNAGSGLFGLCHELSIEKTEAMLGLNIVALSSLCALFARDMGAAGGGRILNVGSLAGNFALPYFAAYAASKSYVLSFSLALRAELKKSGIGVSCLLPGYVKTGFDEAAGITSPAYRSFSESAGMSADAVAKAGLSALDADRPFTVAGFGNKAAALFGRLLPRSAMPALVKPFLDRMISANAADEHGSRS
jgi:short-subunit dehydrogenase